MIIRHKNVRFSEQSVKGEVRESSPLYIWEIKVI